MKEWPLRQELRQHREHVDGRFDRLERKVDQMVDHSHREHPTFMQTIAIISAVTSLVGGLVIVLG